jgi:CHASE1-domain containing sensor protein
MLNVTSLVDASRLNFAILRWPLAVVLSGVALAIAQYVLLTEHQKEEVASEFQAIADRLPARIAERMKVYEYGLLSARGAFVAAGGVEGITRSKFHIINK